MVARHPLGVAPRRREVEAGLARGRRLLSDLCRQLDDAIRGAGLTYSAVGRAVGLSGDQVGRVCRGEARRAGIVQLSELFAVVGLELSARAFPSGDTIRDRPQLALLERFRTRLGVPLPLRYEVAVIDRTMLSAARVDLRAWDAVITLGGKAVALEAESRVGDVQALLRRLELKRRDGAVDRLLLLLNNTAHHRALLAEHGPTFRAQFPGSARAVMRALRSGLVPSEDAILIL